MNQQETEFRTKTTPALEIEGLRHAYGSLVAVDGVSLTIEPGELVCLLGPSGCGKSTTLRLVAGIERPLDGTIRMEGVAVADGQLYLPPEERRTGLVFQDFALFPHLTVLQNVLFGLRSMESDAATERAHFFLKQVGLDALSEKFPNMLSGGEQQRVALARALAPHPRLMLMDEPFSGLDRRLRDQIRDDTLALLKTQETAALLVTHDPEEALRMADRIALMRDGKLVQVGGPMALYNHPVDLATAAFFSDLNVFHGTAQQGAADSPFGAILAPGFEDGAAVTLAFRPHAAELTKSGGSHGLASIRRTRLLGDKGLVELSFPSITGSVFSIITEPTGLPEAGAETGISVRAEDCFVFEGHQEL